MLSFKSAVTVCRTQRAGGEDDDAACWVTVHMYIVNELLLWSSGSSPEGELEEVTTL